MIIILACCAIPGVLFLGYRAGRTWAKLYYWPTDRDSKRHD